MKKQGVSIFYSYPCTVLFRIPFERISFRQKIASMISNRSYIMLTVFLSCDVLINSDELGFFMVLILVGKSEYAAQVWSKLDLCGEKNIRFVTALEKHCLTEINQPRLLLTCAHISICYHLIYVPWAPCINCKLFLRIHRLSKNKISLT